MKTFQIETDVQTDGTLKLEIPSGLPPGPVEVLVVLQPRAEPPLRLDWRELQGLGQEIWEGIDAQDYVEKLRAEWGP